MSKVSTTRKIDYELKSRVLANGCVKAVKKNSLAVFKYVQRVNEFIRLGNVDELATAERCLNKSIERLNHFNDEEISEALKVNQASLKRNQRLKDRVERMLIKDNVIFLTLTFRDDVLASTSAETRKRYIARFLKSSCSEYVANVDYGKTNEREHYHAVVIAYNNIIDNQLYNYGAINFERVRYDAETDNETTSKRLSKYVNKLVNHAIKNTVKQNRVIYSRGV